MIEVGLKENAAAQRATMAGASLQEIHEKFGPAFMRRFAFETQAEVDAFYTAAQFALEHWAK